MNRPIFAYLAIGIALSACQPSQKNAEDASTEIAKDTTAVEVEDNMLSDAQKSDGWKLLFNGKDTEGWRMFKNKENNSWEVVDGTLHCKPFDAADKRADLMTVDQYADFDLAFDWKISPQSNSGVIFRVTEEFEEPYFSGPEYQLLDDKGYPGDVKPVHYTGSNYDMHPAPPTSPVKPVGEWNTSRIVAKGNHIEHWLNGTKLLEYEIGSAEWTKLRDGSKWKDVKGYCVSKTGFIDLQDHGNEVWFKNVMIKSL
jgi:hypothetical protein